MAKATSVTSEWSPLIPLRFHRTESNGTLAWAWRFLIGNSQRVLFVFNEVRQMGIMGMKCGFPRLAGVQLLAAGCLCVCQPALLLVSAETVSAQYQYRRDDIMININTQTTVFPVLNLLNGASYEFHYHNNGAVCPKPHITLSVNPFEFTGSGSADLLKGTSQAYVRVFTGVHAEVSECLFKTVSPNIYCDTNIVPLVGIASASSILLRPLCVLSLDAVPVMFFFTEVTSQYPIVLPDRYSVTLPASFSSNGLTLDVSYAAYKDGAWQVLPPPLDKVRAFPLRGRGIFGTSPSPAIKDPSNYVIARGDHLILSATVRPDEVVPTADVHDELSNIMPWSSIFGGDPYTIGFIRVRDSLIAPRNVPAPKDQRFGILGGLFPLQIQATYKSDNLEFPIVAKMVLGSLTVRFDADGSGAPLISAAISVDFRWKLRMAMMARNYQPR